MAGAQRPAQHRQAHAKQGERPEALELTPRSLRRRLAEEQTSFEALRDEVRVALAGELLSQTTLSVEQIAERLGYSELSCFSRAYKRWTGHSPRSVRRSALQT